jgi:hypothetical protein
MAYVAWRHDLPTAPTNRFIGEAGFVVRAEEQPAWAEIVRRAERGESVPVIAHGNRVADIVPSGNWTGCARRP